jgi:hypothetical protein
MNKKKDHEKKKRENEDRDDRMEDRVAEPDFLKSLLVVNAYNSICHFP